VELGLWIQSFYILHVNFMVVLMLRVVVLQIYASDHTSNIYGSSPSTPVVGSPPPLAGKAIIFM